MDVAELRSLRLTAFKSFRDVTVPIENLTVLTGRNSSGKSNVLGGIEVLSRLAGGEDLRDALDSRRREGGPIRGGSRGCAPHGLDYFALGCDVSLSESTYQYDITIQVDPELRIIHERLLKQAPDPESGTVEQHQLLPGQPSDSPYHRFWAASREEDFWAHSHGTELLTPHISRTLALQGEASALAQGTQAVVAASRGIFHLDPVPHLMRDYVDKRDANLHRTGENVSAAIAHLQDANNDTFQQLTRLIQEVADERISGIEVAPSTLGDVMLALPGELNHNVLACYRDPETGYTKLSRLTELPGYAEAMASGRLGDVVAADRMVRPEETSGDFSEFNRLLGIE